VLKYEVVIGAEKVLVTGVLALILNGLFQMSKIRVESSMRRRVQPFFTPNRSTSSVIVIQSGLRLLKFQTSQPRPSGLDKPDLLPSFRKLALTGSPFLDIRSPGE